MKPLSLRLRLTLIYAALSALVLAGFGGLFYRTLAVRLEKSLDQELDERAAALRGYLHFPNGRPQLVFDEKDPEEAFFIRTATRHFQVLDASTGEVLIQSQELQLLGVSPSLDEVRAQVQRPHRGWLECAVLNLLDNAIKFTSAGGVVDVTAAAQGRSVCPDFRDSGIGISAEALPHIFEHFYRAEASRSKEVEGAGLGLALVKWVVENHQGSVAVESHVGQGSCFRVSLPAVLIWENLPVSV